MNCMFHSLVLIKPNDCIVRYRCWKWLEVHKADFQAEPNKQISQWNVTYFGILVVIGNVTSESSIHAQEHNLSLTTANNPISQWFPPNGEQPEQRKLTHTWPTDGCRAIFHKCCYYTKHGSIITNYPQRNVWGHIIEMSRYHNGGIRSMDRKILRFMFKNI